jgi:hypothetical protein
MFKHIFNFFYCFRKRIRGKNIVEILVDILVEKRRDTDVVLTNSTTIPKR